MLRWFVALTTSAAACAVGACRTPSRAPSSVDNRADATWPPGDTLQLTWVVGMPNIPHPKWDGVMMQAVTLEVAIGGAVRALDLEPQMGSLFPHNQSACKSTTYPLAPGEVARIVFDEGEARGYVVRRPRPTVLEVSPMTSSAGAQRIEVPAQVKVSETILELDVNGARTPIRCEEP